MVLPLPWLVAFVLGGRQHRAMTATAIWFSPWAMLGRTMPDWTLAAAALWAIHLTATVRREPLGEHRPLSALSAVSYRGRWCCWRPAGR